MLNFDSFLRKVSSAKSYFTADGESRLGFLHELSGLEAHHLVEKRFARLVGVAAKDMKSIALTKAEHQVFTNAWRRAIPYGAGTANATKQQVTNAAREIYANHPAILRALFGP